MVWLQLWRTMYVKFMHGKLLHNERAACLSLTALFHWIIISIYRYVIVFWCFYLEKYDSVVRLFSTVTFLFIRFLLLEYEIMKQQMSNDNVAVAVIECTVMFIIIADLLLMFQHLNFYGNKFTQHDIAFKLMNRT